MSNTTVKTVEETSKSVSSKICGICEENSSKYCCPRCEVYYCSLVCYKSMKHADCSEGFYRDCVTDELAGNHTDEASRQKMIEILKRIQESGAEDPEQMEELLRSVQDGREADSDDNDYTDLQDRIEGLNLDDPEALWSVLTEDERNEFEALVNQGDVSAIVPEWQPWWLYRREEHLVQEVEALDDSEHLKSCPKILEVPSLSSLTSVRPSPTVGCDIANVCAAYALTQRYLNGDAAGDEAAALLLAASGALCGASYADAELAVEAVRQACLQSSMIQTDEQSLDVMKEDTLLILQGPSKDRKSYYCKCALSHIHSLFTDAKAKSKSKNKQIAKSEAEFSKKFQDQSGTEAAPLDVTKLKKCIKKIEYYLAFLQTHGDIQ